MKNSIEIIAGEYENRVYIYKGNDKLTSTSHLFFNKKSFYISNIQSIETINEDSLKKTNSTLARGLLGGALLGGIGAIAGIAKH